MSPSPDDGDWRRLMREAGVGRLLWHTCYRPLNALKRSWTEGGPVEQWRTEAGRREMVEAATCLPQLSPPARDVGATVAYLSGRAHWYQTLFCFVSLQLALPEHRITPQVFDDGTLDDEVTGHMRRVVPWMTFRTSEQIRARLDDVLPAQSFPTLRQRRVDYPHLRKLTDIHVCSHGWTLVLDSDMLFHTRPDAIAAWFRTPQPICMRDVVRSYGYPLSYLEQQAGCALLDKVNVGICGMYSPDMPWALVEQWCRAQLEAHGPHYLQEQALGAMLLSRTQTCVLPRRDYVVQPDPGECARSRAALHHYVAGSKRDYFRHGWRLVRSRLAERDVQAAA